MCFFLFLLKNGQCEMIVFSKHIYVCNFQFYRDGHVEELDLDELSLVLVVFSCGILTGSYPMSSCFFEYILSRSTFVFILSERIFWI